VVVLDLSGVFDLEYTALKMLIEGEKRSRVREYRFWLAGAQSGGARRGPAFVTLRNPWTRSGCTLLWK
jgi:hypothetical protein